MNLHFVLDGTLGLKEDSSMLKFLVFRNFVSKVVTAFLFIPTLFTDTDY